MKLSDDLKKWRAERPDEWTMDRFIKQAKTFEDIDDRPSWEKKELTEKELFVILVEWVRGDMPLLKYLLQKCHITRREDKDKITNKDMDDTINKMLEEEAEHIKRSASHDDTQRIDWLEKEFGCGLVNDDNGHWAVSYDGIQNVPAGSEASDITTSFWIEKHQWRNSVREAIDDAMDESET